MESETVKFLANVPVHVALEYSKGKAVEGTRGEPRVMFTLVDGRKMFLDPFVARKIDELGVGRGEAFVVCKAQTAMRGGATVEWEVYRPGADCTGKRRQEPEVRSQERAPASEDAEMLRMLKSAIAAVQAAEKCLTIALTVVGR